MRLIKVHFSGKIFFMLILGLIILLASQVFVFAASSPMKLNLEKSIQIALENNIGYKITESTVDISRAQVKEAEGAKKLNMKFRGGYLQMSETLDEEDMEAGDYSDLFLLVKVFRLSL